MQAMDVHCYLIVVVWYHAQADVNVIKPGLAAAPYASVKKVAQITHLIHEVRSQKLLNCHLRRIKVYLYCLISHSAFLASSY